MLIFPAIDMKDGECVRLRRGDYATAQKVAENALQAAQSFEADGAKWLHMVDLNGAKDAHPVNASLVFQVAQNTGLKVEIGGGIRRMDTIEYYLNSGIARVILGSAALNNPDFTTEAIRTYGDKIVIGIDARDGFVAAEGWLETSSVDYIAFAKQMEQLGAQTIIFTDISRDGMLSGPNLEMLDKLNRAVSCNIVASGGIRNAKDITALRKLGLYGAICGKSLYSGTLKLADAVAAAGGQNEA
ncbi:1-(5-phosphoribosyl)-5-[(5-phosphoribosylamino)methylideneamino]imidazole-4-carboxamide isomerase [Caproicibacterium amylolyticum]|uniref:1-(5-phosphoribosyl)-5-[(5-phosphoribosylamino)methylideneamino] imidazole-4-carboxamide isomerase n=1 Tax=Caproicibacterium amylolyticum TaxID=2766537 RepID=A0A7G9WKW1_9FIRM|nr:1-(5-phosphoribosyl)-5-[(5-phosphoribosylamino)methylideneamino]imidazole-4-carboxamide isomerase [Caproicibacterium amylolyticum]QNO19323.1 1-(5-phosphoribosyl)-5-[(5-phosphoribosylamino)methylideneamino]imidazole-4-carboxamide isomerase [Caproicibacterium amylolyticum]